MRHGESDGSKGETNILYMEERDTKSGQSNKSRFAAYFLHISDKEWCTSLQLDYFTILRQETYPLLMSINDTPNKSKRKPPCSIQQGGFMEV